MIDGTCDGAFSSVRTAFEENFTSRGEASAALCITADGRVVTDLWGGTARVAGRTLPWQPDTLVNLFSVGKGLIAVLAARLAGQGMLDVDAPVARYWPQFAAAGKETVTVRHLLTHQAGLPALRQRLPAGTMLNWRAMTAALAAERPWWRPGTAHGYHVNTFGFLAGEVLRRVTGLSIGALLRSELAGPLGADLYIGLPAAEHGRVADFDWPGPLPPDRDEPGLAADQLMVQRAYFNPGGLSGAGVINTAAWRAAEVPSANAHGTARGVARVYTALAAGGVADGVRIVDSGALAEAASEQVCGHDLVLLRPSRFGLGFQLTQPERPLGPHAGTFGHFGAGGSVGFCDPQACVGFGYVTGQMGPRWQNPRNRALIDALYACL